MKNILTWNFSLKFMFVALLFTIFVWKFAVPSFRKFFYSGVMIDKSWADRLTEDSPAVTFCAKNNETGLGWKTNKTMKGEDWYDSAIVFFCNNQTVEYAVDCLHKQTFNLTESIKTPDINYENPVKADQRLWK